MKILAKIFDPLGLVTPVTFFGKVFLQELWKEGISWDELLSDNLCVKWKETLHLFSKDSFTIPSLLNLRRL